MSIIAGLSNIIKSVCNYKNINEYSDIKLRNNKNGITLNDAIHYRFSYSQFVPD